MHRALVVGATGNVGRQVVRQLHDQGATVRALARNRMATSFPAKVEVVQGDLTIPRSLDLCLEGVDAVFLAWTAPASTAPAVLERIAARAKRMVFLSSPYKTPHPFFQKPQPNPISDLHRHIEQIIIHLPVEWTFLRPGMFAGNAVRWWAPQIQAGDLVQWPYLTAATAPIDERDIAAVAVRALCEDRHAGAEYVITGSQDLTQFEQISIIGRALGRRLCVEELPPERAREVLFARWPASIVDMLFAAWAAAVDEPAYMTSEVAEITGTPPRTFLQWATDHVSDFHNNQAP